MWPRAAKSVPISPQVRAVLDITAETLTPTELLSAILKAPVDLLYNGGIGTYVKASTESHAEVGDRANDGLRIDGRDLRCQVLCEGGNLGLTQRGRIEAAQLGNAGKGVRLYTDAIDNSAGVDTSDHEVNIKILLGLSIADGELTEKQRNQQLAELTDDVAALVLRDNYFQTQILSLTRRTGARLLDAQARFIRHLEKTGLLNRALEFLPSDEEIAERKIRGAALTNPELSVLLAYSKMWLSDQLVDSDLPDDPWVAAALARYFPVALSQRFGHLLPRHPLRREIIATHVLNSMINRVGITFVHRLMEATGAQPAQVVRAYLLARESFGHVGTWQGIEALDNQVPDQAQFEMLTEVDRLTLRGTRWFLRSKRLDEPMAQTIARYVPAVNAFAAELLDETHPATRAPIDKVARPWSNAGVPAELARRVASSEVLVGALDVAELAEQTRQPLERVAHVHIAVGERLGLSKMRALIAALPSDNYWQGLAKGSLTDDLANLQRLLTAEALQHASSDDIGRTIAAWEQGERAALERAQRLLQELAEAKVRRSRHAVGGAARTSQPRLMRGAPGERGGASLDRSPATDRDRARVARLGRGRSGAAGRRSDAPCAAGGRTDRVHAAAPPSAARQLHLLGRHPRRRDARRRIRRAAVAGFAAGSRFSPG